MPVCLENLMSMELGVGREAAQGYQQTGRIAKTQERQVALSHGC